MAKRQLKVASIGVDHLHARLLLSGFLETGAEAVGWWTEKPSIYVEGFVKQFPDVPRVEKAEQLLEDPTIDVICVASEGADRARHAIAAMEHGKDVLSDKPGCISLEELEAIRKTVGKTGRKWGVRFAEHLKMPALVKAKELLDEGAVGRLVNIVGLGPQRLRLNPRPDWFFDPKRYGGILADLAIHQFDNFMYFAGADPIEITAATIGNFANPEHPAFEDFGEVMFSNGKVQGYSRVDWFTPDALPLNPGDARIFIMGTTGHIEIRKFIDVTGRPGKEHLFLVDKTRCEYLDCSKAPQIGDHERFSNDVRDRSESWMSQEYMFTVAELALKAQNLARRIGDFPGH